MLDAQVLDSKHRPALTERALLSNLTAITADAARTPPNQVAQSALGVLSTERRATWAACRAGLMKNEGNAMCLDVIDKALFVVALDDTSPESATEMCNNMLCGTYKLEKGVQVGTCTNRWYDKVRPPFARPRFAKAWTDESVHVVPRAAPDHRRRKRRRRRQL